MTSPNIGSIGVSHPRRDLPEKLTGQAVYTADVRLPGMLHGAILRCPYPHARITAVDASRAAALPGVYAVLTPFDAPDGRVAPDLPILDTRARFVGDEVAAVAADDEDTARQALRLIDVTYEPLRFVTDPVEAMNPGAPSVHEGGNLVGGKPIALERGNVEEGFAQADHIFEDEFATQSHSGAALEPRAAVAAWDDGRLTVWKSSRGIHADRLSLSLSLGIPRENVRVVGPHMGAGYGNKDETRLAAITAILARRAGRPVKVELSREEEFVGGRHRHATTTKVRVGVTNDGTVTAVHATTIMDTGAYLSSGPGVVRRAGQGALYLYRCANARYDGYLVYTNQPSAGSYRALGAPQGHFALESLADRIAEDLGIDPLDFRLKNHIGPEGQPGERITPLNQVVDTQPVEGGVPFSSNGLRECLERGAAAIGWRERRNAPPDANSAIRRGMGMSMFVYRGGPGGRSIARMRLENDGTATLTTGIMDVGEGSLTVLAQVAAETLGVAYDSVRVVSGRHAAHAAGAHHGGVNGDLLRRAGRETRRRATQRADNRGRRVRVGGRAGGTGRRGRGRDGRRGTAHDACGYRAAQCGTAAPSRGHCRPRQPRVRRQLVRRALRRGGGGYGHRRGERRQVRRRARLGAYPQSQHGGEPGGGRRLADARLHAERRDDYRRTQRRHPGTPAFSNTRVPRYWTARPSR